MKLLQGEVHNLPVLQQQQQVLWQKLGKQEQQLEFLELQLSALKGQCVPRDHAACTYTPDIAALHNGLKMLEKKGVQQQLARLLQQKLQHHQEYSQCNSPKAVTGTQVDHLAKQNQQMSLQQQMKATQARAQVCNNVCSRQRSQIAADLTETLATFTSSVNILSEVSSQRQQQSGLQQQSDSTGSAAVLSSSNAAPEALVQSLLSQLLPKLVTMRLSCGMLSADKAWLSRALYNGSIGSSVADVLGVRFVEKNQESKSAALLQLFSGNDALESIITISARKALIESVFGDGVNEQLQRHPLAQLLPGLLSSKPISSFMNNC